MNRVQFSLSLASTEPPAGISDYLAALWYDAKGDWESSHLRIQDVPGPMAAWIHAYLHRKEGDPGNAAYWYAKAGRNMPAEGLEKEWEKILGELLDQ